MNSYSVLLRNESASPPCQPASPTPLLIAASRFRSCSGLMAPWVNAWTMRSSFFSFSPSL